MSTNTTNEITEKQNQLVAEYEAMLNNLAMQGDADSLLIVLIKRSQLASIIRRPHLEPNITQRTNNLDNQLRNNVKRVDGADWEGWRQVVLPPSNHWWWQLDKVNTEEAKYASFPWIAGTSVLIIISASLTAEILSRFWAIGPDSLTALLAIASLVFTTIPLTKYGRELGSWFLRNVIQTSNRIPNRGVFVVATVALLLVIVLRFLGLPLLARHYNNEGVRRLQSGNLTIARYYLERSVSLNPDFSAGYYNLANSYERVGEKTKAQEYYLAALGTDMTFELAYNNLGRLKIEEGRIEDAIGILREGLLIASEDIAKSALHTNLGRAYYESERYNQSIDELTKAIEIDQRLGPPYCYMGLVYDEVNRGEDAVLAWENCLRYSLTGTSDGAEWSSRARARLEDEDESQ